MSDAEKQLLLDTIHQQLNDAISYNLYTGLAYGTLNSPFSFPPSSMSNLGFSPFGVRNVPRLVLHLNQDTSVRVIFISRNDRALSFSLTPS